MMILHISLTWIGCQYPPYFLVTHQAFGEQERTERQVFVSSRTTALLAAVLFTLLKRIRVYVHNASFIGSTTAITAATRSTTLTCQYVFVPSFFLSFLQQIRARMQKLGLEFFDAYKWAVEDDDALREAFDRHQIERNVLDAIVAENLFPEVRNTRQRIANRLKKLGLQLAQFNNEKWVNMC